MQFLAGLLVLLTACWLIGSALWLVLRKAQAGSFLLGFASSLRAHVLEQGLRLLVGAALLVRAPSMLHPPVFVVFGWLLIGTSAMLLLLPWRWHHRFAQWAVPMVLQHHRLYALGSFTLGVMLAWALLAG